MPELRCSTSLIPPIPIILMCIHTSYENSREDVGKSNCIAQWSKKAVILNMTKTETQCTDPKSSQKFSDFKTVSLLFPVEDVKINK